MDYQNNCLSNLPKEYKEKIEINCQNELNKIDEDCYINESEYISEDSFNSKCKAIKSNECKKYISITESISVCNLYYFSNLDDSDITEEMEFIKYKSNDKYVKSNEICEVGYDILLLSNISPLFEDKYGKCTIENKTDNEDDLYYQCLFFTSDICQEFYHKPLNDNPIFSIIQEKNVIFVSTLSHPKWQFYYDTCFKLVESRRVTKSVESTTTKSIETTTIDSSEQITTKSIEPKTTKSSKIIKTKSIKPIIPSIKHTKKVSTKPIKKTKTQKKSKKGKTSKKVSTKKVKTSKKISTKKVKPTKKIVIATKKGKSHHKFY